MTDTIFFRLLDGVDRPSRLTDAVEKLHKGKELADVHAVDSDSFRQIPGSPFSYWVTENVRRLFVEMAPLESEGRENRVGLQTSDNFRFLRAWWMPTEAAINRSICK